MRNKFDEQMEVLNRELLEMGTLLETAGEKALNALVTGDESSAKEAIKIEEDVDQKERDIESLCLKLLLQQQPVAKDLRNISAALKMITDMERIGDQIADIAEISLFMTKVAPYKKLEHLPQMAEAVNTMLKSSIDSFVKADKNLAEQVIQMDDIVDDLFTVIRKEIIQMLLNSGHSDIVSSQALDFLMMAKYYERIGDHIVNIAEWVLFSLTGLHKIGD